MNDRLGQKEAAAEIARRARIIAPISHKSDYTYLGPDQATQRQRLLKGAAKTPRMETGARVLRHTARAKQVKHRVGLRLLACWTERHVYRSIPNRA